jgi:hypothetical protein
MSIADIVAQSPAALAIPDVTGADDAALAARMSRRWPAFGSREGWGTERHYQRELDMGTDRDLFGDFPEGLPVYEGRMVDQFDHQAKAYRSGRGRAAVWEELPFGDPRKVIVPQWRILPDKVPSKLGDRPERYRIGWCDVTSPRNERSLLAALIPPGVVCGDKVPTLAFPPELVWAYMPWLAVANSFCMDYLVRKKVALKLSMNVMDSLPFPRFEAQDPVVQRLGYLAVRLSCTSTEMTAYWNQIAAERGWGDAVPSTREPPGFSDPDLRGAARAEIDALVAKQFFELSRSELGGILDTFPVLRRREERAYGDFVSRTSVLEAYDRLVAAGAS